MKGLCLCAIQKGEDEKVFQGKKLRVNKARFGLENCCSGGRGVGSLMLVNRANVQQSGIGQGQKRKHIHLTVSHPEHRLLQVNEAFIEKNIETLSGTWIGVARNSNSLTQEIKDWLS